MFKLVTNENADNVVNFPDCGAQYCKHAARCPIRQALLEGSRAPLSAAFFAGVANGDTSVNKITEEIQARDVDPLIRILKTTLRRLCAMAKLSRGLPMAMRPVSFIFERRRQPRRARARRGN